MQATAAVRAREHQVVFCGLEVLRLIGERIESRDEVDREDINTVLTFMRSVAHRCLGNTEDLLQIASMDQRLAGHRRARSLFDELERADGEQFADRNRRAGDSFLSFDLPAFDALGD